MRRPRASRGSLHLLLSAGLERAHVVQPVGELDEDDADVLRRSRRSSCGTSRPGPPRGEVDPRQLGDALDQPGDRRPNSRGAPRSSSRCPRRRRATAPPRSTVVGWRSSAQIFADGKRVADERLTRAPQLTRMPVGGKVERWAISCGRLRVCSVVISASSSSRRGLDAVPEASTNRHREKELPGLQCHRAASGGQERPRRRNRWPTRLRLRRTAKLLPRAARRARPRPPPRAACAGVGPTGAAVAFCVSELGGSWHSFDQVVREQGAEACRLEQAAPGCPLPRPGRVREDRLVLVFLAALGLPGSSAKRARAPRRAGVPGRAGSRSSTTRW